VRLATAPSSPTRFPAFAPETSIVPAAPTNLRRLAVAAAVTVAFACNHSEPFGPPAIGSTQPFDPAPPVRLTLNQAADRDASWLPDGSGILYSARQAGRHDQDVCLAELPPTGGSQRRLVCDLSGTGAETTDAIETPALAPDGRLAFVKALSAINAISPGQQAVSVASGADPRTAADVQPIPYTVPGEPRHSAVLDLRWQSPSRLVFVGSRWTYRVPCQFCMADTIVSGLEVGMLDLSGGAGTLSVLAGTDFASGVTTGGSEDEVYFTLGGDSRVYRRVLSTGATDVVYDFGAAGIARDVHAAAGRMTAVVGGRVAFSADPELGPTQWDSGGIVHVVDLASGADVALDGPGLFRRPALSPQGDRIVAEGYPLIITPVIDPGTGEVVGADTTVGRAGDLYLFGAP
jgi:hypothetical protein